MLTWVMNLDFAATATADAPASPSTGLPVYRYAVLMLLIGFGGLS